MLRMDRFLYRLLGILFSLNLHSSPLYAVQISTEVSLSSGHFSSLTSVNGASFASGQTASGIGAIFDVSLTSLSATVIAGSILNSFHDGIGTNAGVFDPKELVLDPRSSQSLYFVDLMTTANAYAIRKLVISTANVTTVLGNGATCTLPEMGNPLNGPSLQTTACALGGMAMDMNGNLYYLDYNILRVFHVDLGTVVSLVGSYNGNPNNPAQYIDSLSGASAYMASPVSLALAESGAGLWILDAAGSVSIHYINISNSAYPMVTSATTSASGSASASNWVSVCSSGMSSSLIYIVAQCSSSSSSGQVLTLDVNSHAVTNIAGGGSCQQADGQDHSASFFDPSACVSASATSSGEMLLIADETTAQIGIIRAVSIGNAPTLAPSSSTPSGHSSFAERTTQLNVLLVSEAVVISVALLLFFA